MYWIIIAAPEYMRGYVLIQRVGILGSGLKIISEDDVSDACLSLRLAAVTRSPSEPRKKFDQCDAKLGRLLSFRDKPSGEFNAQNLSLVVVYVRAFKHKLPILDALCRFAK